MERFSGEVFGKAFRILRWVMVQEIHGNLRVNFPCSLRKQPTFGDATTGFPAKWRLRNERRNSILITRHYQDLGNSSDWSCHVGNLIQPIRRTTQILGVTRRQSGISALVYQTSFGGETNGSVAKCKLFSQASFHVFFLPFSSVSFIESCSFWHGLKHLLTLHKLADKVVLDR